MLQKIKKAILNNPTVQKALVYLETRPKEYELLRYLIAGGLTTVLSLVTFSLYCITVAPDHTINGASPAQAGVGNVVSWIIAVLFAFWINRRMVFQQKGGAPTEIFKALWQFVLSRLASGLLFEFGPFCLFRLMAEVWHVSNLITKLVVLVLVTVFNYLVSKFLIFSKKDNGEKNPQT